MNMQQIPKYTSIGEIRRMRSKSQRIDAITENVIMGCEAGDEIGVRMWSRQLKKYTS